MVAKPKSPLQRMQDQEAWRQFGANARTRDTMGVNTVQQNHNLGLARQILGGGYAPPPSDLSGFGKRFLQQPMQPYTPLNSRGLDGFQPSGGPVKKPLERPVPPGASHLPGAPQTQLYTQPLDGSRPRFVEGRTMMNSAGGMTEVFRTPTGGLGFRGDGGTPMTPEQQAILANRKQTRKDEGILRNARRYGLGANVPAVGAAMARMAGKQRKGQAAQQEQAMMQDMMAQQLESHLQSLPDPASRLRFLQGLQGGASGGQQQLPPGPQQVPWWARMTFGGAGQ